MTMDSSLRIQSGGVSTRSVLTRVERIAKLKEQERWSDGRSPLGLPKVRVYKLAMKKKKVKSKEEADEKKAASKGGAAKPAAGAAKPAAAAAKPAAKK